MGIVVAESIKIQLILKEDGSVRVVNKFTNDFSDLTDEEIEVALSRINKQSGIEKLEQPYEIDLES